MKQFQRLFLNVSKGLKCSVRVVLSLVFCFVHHCLSFCPFSTYAISAYHHSCYEFESQSGRGVQHYVIKFVSDLRQVSGFLRALRFPPPIKLTVTI